MARTTYKTTDLFGNEETHFLDNKRKEKSSFLDYDGFIEKFELKKTTDDCYTPPEIYNEVLRYVAEKVDIRNKQIFRPFVPGGDYMGIEYPPDSIVIDNPPFSILADICNYYILHSVPFFLFAPHLTLFGAKGKYTRLVAGCDIIYENGASVKTSFVSNMFGDIAVISCPELYAKIKAMNQARKLPKYIYPTNLITVSFVQKLTEAGINYSVPFRSVAQCRALKSQKAKGKTIFGGGFLLSERAALERAALERAALERAALERAESEVVIWDIAKEEKEIIDSLE